jgi:Na+/H+ antiporter NhaD/arsenite permease-like protein
MVILFFIHGTMHWEPWVVAVLGLTMLIGITYKANLEKYLAEIELTLLLFFVSLFVLIGGVESSQFLEYMAGFIQPFVEKDMLLACLMVIWVTGFLSAVIDR